MFILKALILLVPAVAFSKPTKAPEVPLTLESFARYRLIEAPGQSPLYQIDVADEVYTNVQSDHLDDVRIFNASGDILPHSFQLSESEQVHTTEEHALTYYPILGEENRNYAGPTVVQMDGASQKISVRFGEAGAKNKQITRGFLMDLRKTDKPLRRLILDWNSQNSSSYLTLDVSKSDNLTEWTPVGHDYTVARFQYGGQKLEQNVIDLPDVQAKYLKLTWREQKPFPLKSIRGEFAKGTWVEPKRHSTKVSTHEMDEGFPLYVKSPTVTDRVNILLPENNTMLNVVLWSKSSPTGYWNRRYAGMVYRLKIDQKELNSPAVKITPTSDRYWKLQVVGKDASFGKHSPELDFSWTAHQLFFLARGEGPYKMAYGNANAQSPDFGFSSLLGPLSEESAVKPVPALLGTEVVVQQAAVVPAAPGTLPVDYKKWLLWVSLIACVLVTSFMAWKLFGEMGGKA